jgi:hypothetical protein
MSEDAKTEIAAPFYEALARCGVDAAAVCDLDDAVERRILEDYGAVLVAGPEARRPPRCVFENAAEVEEFQAAAGVAGRDIGGVFIELQPAAMAALCAACGEAQQAGLAITPRGGAEAARRDFDGTVRLWLSRVEPALIHWQTAGRLSAAQTERIRRLSLREQVREVLELETQGIFFSKDLSKSILYSVAAPGASQHLSMLALDVAEFLNPSVRAMLARHGWFQTVQSDLPHFTFLGLSETDLPARGLRRVNVGEQAFWIPNVNYS